MRRLTAAMTGILVLVGLLVGCSTTSQREDPSRALADTLEQSLYRDLLPHWYPRVIDSTHGGYLSHFSYDWKRLDPQDKFVVTQARHVWTTAQMHEAAPRDDSLYLRVARHGVRYLADHLWDPDHGGFHSMVDRSGVVQTEGDAFTGTKNAYGQAFAIYGLAGFYGATGDTSALKLAQRTFRWLDENAHDDEHGGYFRALRRDGRPYANGYQGEPSKGQNSTIHLLEAFTALYEVAPETPRLRERLQELLVLTRDTMTSARGSLRLFFTRDWRPVSFRDSSMTVREKNYSLDHRSFGHDVETAYLMLEATEALGQDPGSTLTVGKRMVDHALQYGWDNTNGGLYDGGFVVGPDSVAIIRSTKAWWSQAEALHTFLVMEERFPADERNYGAKARATWRYIDEYLIDHEHGGWYVSGVDQSPNARTEPKATIWKGTYHNTRALLQGTEVLRSK